MKYIRPCKSRYSRVVSYWIVAEFATEEQILLSSRPNVPKWDQRNHRFAVRGVSKSLIHDTTVIPHQNNKKQLKKNSGRSNDKAPIICRVI